ncbi:adhesion G-protein coupled receptor G4 isoform X6 [Hydra vulgaris]|uniref:Adhesion G-protein coupled receptor G4 isoform X6 n=1 Tax=Hydra vulgaris TaxID=6087 RepID=A0ABM4DNZ9_HYDVU
MFYLAFKLMVTFQFVCNLRCEQEILVTEINTDNSVLQINSCNTTGEIEYQSVTIFNKLWETKTIAFNISTEECDFNNINKLYLTGQNGLKLVFDSSFQLKTKLKVGGGLFTIKYTNSDIPARYLGGFTYDSKTCTTSTHQFHCPEGVGPGANQNGATNGFDKNGVSIWGEDYGNGDVYLGGSVGPQVDLLGSPGNGGGVFILFVNGNLFVNADISADGYENQDNKNCSGGSAGGFILIKANEIRISDNVSIHANGGSSGRNKSSFYCTNGGAGGIISLNTLYFNGDIKSLSVRGGMGIKPGNSGKIIVQTVFRKDLIINTTSCVLQSSDYPNFTFYGKIIEKKNKSCLLDSKCEFTFMHSVKILQFVKLKLTGSNQLSFVIKSGGMEVFTKLNFLANCSSSEVKYLCSFNNDNETIAIGGLIEIVVEHGNLSLFASIEAGSFKTEHDSHCKSSSGTILIQADYINFKTNESFLSVLGSKNGGEGGLIRIIGKIVSDYANSSSIEYHHIKIESDAEQGVKGYFLVFESLDSFIASTKNSLSTSRSTQTSSLSMTDTPRATLMSSSLTKQPEQVTSYTTVETYTDATRSPISKDNSSETGIMLTNPTTLDTANTTTVKITDSSSTIFLISKNVTSTSTPINKDNSSETGVMPTNPTTLDTTNITTVKMTDSSSTMFFTSKNVTSTSTPINKDVTLSSYIGTSTTRIYTNDYNVTTTASMFALNTTVEIEVNIESKIEVINSISINNSNFEPFVNALLNIAKNKLSEKASSILVDAVEKVALYPYNYTNLESISNILSKVVQLCDYMISSSLKSSAGEFTNIEVVSGSLASSLELISLKIGTFLNDSYLAYNLEIGKINLDVEIFNYTEPIKSFPKDCRRKHCDKVEIPMDIFQNKTTATTVTIVSMKLHQEDYSNSGQAIYKNNSWKAVSSIISVSVNNTVVLPFIKPIVLRQKIYTPTNYLYKLSAGYWKNTKRSPKCWAFDGLSIKSQKGNEVVIHSYHMTTFAILMQVTELKISDNDKLALSWIGYLGCGLSLFSYMFTFAIYYLIRSLLTERSLIHLNLVISLSIAQTVFLLGITATYNKSLCTFIAVLLHYFFTAAFGWMLCEGIHLYVKIVSVYNNWAKMYFYHCIGWGTPIIIVSISAAIRSDGYGTEEHCWISINDGLIWAFVGPVILVILINVVVMVMVIKILVSSLNDPVSLNMIELRQKIRASLKGMVILLPILGITWTFGIFAVNSNAIVYQYIFTLSSSVQGVFIFLLHCIGNTEVRSALKRLHENRLQNKTVKKKLSFLRTIAENLRNLVFHESKVYTLNSPKVTNLSYVQTKNSSSFYSLNNAELTSHENHSNNTNVDIKV